MHWGMGVISFCIYKKYIINIKEWRERVIMNNIMGDGGKIVKEI